ERRLHRRARHAVEMRHAGEGQRHDDEEDEDGQRDHDAEDAEGTDPERPPDAHRYWIEIRDGGQYVAITLPIRFLRGTVPHRRESHDPLRLSPIMKYCPFGNVSGSWVKSSRRSGRPYGTPRLLPFM